MSSETRFCKDCIHFEYHHGAVGIAGGYPPQELCRRERSPVWGGATDVSVVRFHSLLCGMDGKWFEQKPPETPRPKSWWHRMFDA